MRLLTISASFQANYVTLGETVAGGIRRHTPTPPAGFAVTPVGRFFARGPDFCEGFCPHRRVDCFLRQRATNYRGEGPLVGDTAAVGEGLAAALLRESLCSEPLLVCWHWAEQVGTRAFGKVPVVG
jgi:hypothetical protein